jgi:glycosyltransferase involved in cell wall biosynthesis
VIYNGIDLKPFLHLNPDGSGHGQALRQKMNWRDKPVIGAIGRLAPEKGLKYLLRAAAGVIQEYPNAQFVLAGDGPDRLSLEAEAKSLGIQNSVSFLGIREDIPDLLSAIDVLAMPSLSEGLPMTLLEGMASGRAVVASAVGSIPCAIRDGVDGILCSAGDADSLSRSLRDLLKSRELRTTLGRNARATVESRFSAASMAGQYAQVYDEMTSVRGPTAGL